MKPEEITKVVIGNILIPNDTFQSVENKMGSAVQCIFIDNNGYRFRRFNILHNREEFFLTKDALEKSQWIQAPINSQMRFI